MITRLQTWPADSVDAIRINESYCNLRVEGIDENLIILEGAANENQGPYFTLDPIERRLKINAPKRSCSRLTLKLSRHKAWVADIFGGHGDIKIAGIQSRLRIMLGNGNIEVADFQGLLALVSGHSNIHLENFCQAEMPQMVNYTARPAAEATNKSSWDWTHWDEAEWESWGEDLGSKIGWWAADIGRLFESGNVAVSDWGLRLQTGNGNLDLAGIEAKTALLKTSHGNLKLENAVIQDLEMGLSKGNIECKSAVPCGKWKAKTSHGNILLSLPENISTRLDMATRNGSVRSQIPMVRVSRPGPESYSGSRMVGSIGPNTEGTLPEISLSTVHGNIEIESGPEYHPPAIQPEVQEESMPVVSESTTVAGSALNPSPAEDNTGVETNTPLGILKALREGKISVDEADRLLRSMEV
jgi:hypothetical protein